MIDLNATSYGYSGGEYIDTSGNLIYTWWCPRCKVDHYTPYCPMENYERLAKLWKDQSCDYKFCPHCGQLVKKEAYYENYD